MGVICQWPAAVICLSGAAVMWSRPSRVRGLVVVSIWSLVGVGFEGQVGQVRYEVALGLRGSDGEGLRLFGWRKRRITVMLTALSGV